jgi:hypothetical protein
MYTETGKGEVVHSDFFKFLKNIRKFKKTWDLIKGFIYQKEKGRTMYMM